MSARRGSVWLYDRPKRCRTPKPPQWAAGAHSNDAVQLPGKEMTEA